MKEKELCIDMIDKENFEKNTQFITELAEERGVSLKELKDKTKEIYKDKHFELKELCNLFGWDFDKFRDDLEKKYVESYGDTSKREWWYNRFNIPENDRLKDFQLFYNYIDIYFQNDKSEFDFEFMKNTLKNTHYFNIEPTLAEIFTHTDSKEANLPFQDFFISANVWIKDRRYVGFFIFEGIESQDWTKEDKYSPNKPIKKMILAMYETKSQDGDSITNMTFCLGFTDLESEESKEVKNFIYSFANFLNEREVLIVEKEFNPKNNERRKERGRCELPRECVIVITGETERYIYKIEEENRKNNYYSIWIRGHFFHFRNKDYWKGVYSMTQEELDKNRYQEVNGIIRFWKRPFISGSGELRKSVYLLKDEVVKKIKCEDLQK